jgi:hypothetical protein
MPSSRIGNRMCLRVIAMRLPFMGALPTREV